jgi:hypothetical protein
MAIKLYTFYLRLVNGGALPSNKAGHLEEGHCLVHLHKCIKFSSPAALAWGPIQGNIFWGLASGHELVTSFCCLGIPLPPLSSNSKNPMAILQFDLY